MDRQTTEKIIETAGLFSVRIPGERRPILLDNILRAGLKSLRPHLPADSFRVARMQITEQMIDLINSARPPDTRLELEALRERVVSLETQIASGAGVALFTEGEMEYIRTLHTFGMSIKQLAEFYEVDRTRIKQVLSKRDIPVVWVRRMRARVARGPRALDVSA